MALLEVVSQFQCIPQLETIGAMIVPHEVGDELPRRDRLLRVPASIKAVFLNMFVVEGFSTWVR